MWVGVDAAVGRKEKNLSGSAPDLHHQEAHQQVLVYGPLGIVMVEYVVFLGSSNVVLEMFWTRSSAEVTI